MPAANVLTKIRDEGYRLAQPADCGDDLYDMLTMCWDEVPEARPKFTTIVGELDELIVELVDMSPPPRDIGLVAEEGEKGGSGSGDEEDSSGDEFV